MAWSFVISLAPLRASGTGGVETFAGGTAPPGSWVLTVLGVHAVRGGDDPLWVDECGPAEVLPVAVPNGRGVLVPVLGRRPSVPNPARGQVGMMKTAITRPLGDSLGFR